MWYLPPQPPHREQRRDLYEGLDKIEIEKEVGTGARARDKLDHAIFLPVTPRVEFKQTQKLDARTILDEKSAYIDPNPSWNMSNANVEMLDRIFKESLWMLDLVLDTPRRPEVFKRAFKDHRYQCAILVLLGWVRILLRSLIEREEQHASKPVLAQSRLKIVMVSKVAFHQ